MPLAAGSGYMSPSSLLPKERGSSNGQGGSYYWFDDSPTSRRGTSAASAPYRFGFWKVVLWSEPSLNRVREIPSTRDQICLGLFKVEPRLSRRRSWK